MGSGWEAVAAPLLLGLEEPCQAVPFSEPQCPSKRPPRAQPSRQGPHTALRGRQRQDSAGDS